MAESIAARAGVTERTFFRHFADKREVFFSEEAELRDALTDAVAAAPALQERAPAKTAALVAALAQALAARGVEQHAATLCARVGMDAFIVAAERWRRDPDRDFHALLDQAFAELRAVATDLT